MPKISVIVAVYNVELYLKRSMDCLMNQTMQDLEFICVDDCSTDKSLDILREYEANDSRFKIITSDKNQGAAVARNKGLEVATGEYLGFIDPDDAIDLSYYEELYKKAQETNADIVKCVMVNIENGKKEKSKLNEKIKYEKLNFTHERTTAIYKSSLIFNNHIKFPSEIRKGQDTLFVLKACLNAKLIVCIDTVNYYYYKRCGSLDSKKLSKSSFLSGLKANCMALDYINQSRLFEESRTDYIKFYESRLAKLIKLFTYRSDEVNSKELVAEAIIKYSMECKDVEKLKENFSYPFIQKYVFNNDVYGLTKYFSKFKTYIDFYLYRNFTERIFSIKDDERKHFIITILGIKIKTKRKDK